LFDESSPANARVKAAREWAEPISAGLAKDFAESVKKKILISRMLEFLGIGIIANKIDEKVNEQFETYKGQVIDVLTPLKLLSDEEYVAAELQKKKEFYDSHVRLVYGGGARNNAELFLPRVLPGAAGKAD
jgi:hypothetical protein